MKRRALLVLLLLVVVASCAPAPPMLRGTEQGGAPPGPTPITRPTASPTAAPSLPPAAIPPPDTLRARAERRGFYIDSAMSYYRLGRGNPRQYIGTLAREFNMLATEQEMKFEPIHPEPGRYDFAAADWSVALAETYQMAVRGHTLVWHNTLPGWLLEGDWTRDELIEILRGHVQTVVGRYRGRVLAWDVVNEAIADDGTFRDCIWLRTIGPEYVGMAFYWAHEADPGALLFYNDGGGEGLGPKSDAIYALVKGLQERGVPIDGVGLEMHVHADAAPDPAAVAQNMQRYAELGLQVHITEMDVFIGVPVTPEKIDRQALVFSQMLETCLAAPNCTAFVVWGFSDRQSWVPYYFAEYDAATLFDRAYRPKPAYDALKAVLGAIPFK